MTDTAAYKSTNTPPQKKLLSTKTKAIIFLSIPVLFLAAGILVASVAAVLSLILIIAAVAVTVGIIVAAIRIQRHKNLSPEEKKLWRYQTYPWLSFLLIAGSVIFLALVYSH